MKIKFLDSDYEDLYYGRDRMNFHPDLIAAFQEKIQVLRNAKNTKDLYNLKSLHFEKLGGDKT